MIDDAVLASPSSEPADLGIRGAARRRSRALVGTVAALVGATVVLVAPSPAGAAVTATTSGGTLSVSLTGNESVRIGCSGGVVGVTTLPSSVFAAASPSLACGSVTAVVVNGDAGDQIVDTRPLLSSPFTANPTLGALLGDGSDEIWETDQNDTIFTSGDNDRLHLLAGTVANTAINLGTGSSDDVTLEGTGGDDTYTMTSTNDDATVTFTGGASSSWTVVDGENFSASLGGGDDTVSLTGVTGASGVGYLSFTGEAGDDTFTSGAKGGYFYGGAGTNTFNLGTSLDSVNSASDTDVISAASDSSTDYVDDFSSLRFGGRTLTGFGGSGQDRYSSGFARNDVTVRVRPGSGGTAVATASLSRTGQQVLPASMEYFGAEVETTPGDIAHRSLVDAVAVGQELQFEDAATQRAIYDITIPTGAWSQSVVGDGVRIDPSAAGFGLITVPAASPFLVHGPWTDRNQGFAHRLHRDLLLQFPSDAVRDDLRDDLDGGSITRTQAARRIVSSPEYRGLDVDRTFVKYLRRPSDAGGRTYWVSSIGNGKALWRFRAQLFGSNEYFTKAGGTNALYVAKAYADVLGRAPDPSGQAYWTNKLNNGADRGSVALQFINSPEARRRLVDDQFLRFLDRKPTSAEQATWVAALPGATGEQDLIVHLASTAEYYDRS